MTNDLLIRVTYQGTVYDLDIDSNIPLRVDMSAVDNSSIGKFFSIGSQSFDLPGTAHNNTFFKHAYMIGADDIPALYSSVDAVIIYRGETLLKGKLQLQEVITDEEGFVVYKVQCNDSVIQFKDALAGKNIADADWTAYAHTLDRNTILTSWSGSLLGGDIFYPLTDYGTDDPDAYPNTLPRIQVGGNVGSIDNVNTPMSSKQFLPAVSGKAVLDVIFDQVGFSYSGNFVESEGFNKVFILPKSQEGLGITGEAGTGNTTNITATSQTIATGSFETGTVPFDNEISDPGNNYDDVTSYTYTAPLDGNYSFAANVNVANPTIGTGKELFMEVNLEVNGTSQDVDFTSITSSDGSFILFAVGIDNYPLTAGDVVKVTYDISWLNPPQNVTILNFNNYFNCTLAPLSYEGVPVDMALQFEPKTKSKDILQGLIEQFNLVLTPDPLNQRLIKIETFDYWMTLGQERNWTNKYNTAKRIGIKHTIDEQDKEILFANANDNDRFSKLAAESAPNYQYGTLEVISDSDIPQGTRKIGSFFGPTVLGSTIVQGNDDFPLSGTTFVVPHLYKFENNKQTAFKFKPRIGYKVDNLLPTGASGGTIYIGEASQYVPATRYSTLSNLQSLPADTGTTFDLHFNNTYVALGGGAFNFNGGVTAFSRYWQTYVESLYWENSRKVTMDIQFYPHEYKTFELNDIIYINTQKYRINKIKGFNLTKPDITTVELIKLYPAFAPYSIQELCDMDFIVEDGTPVPSPTPTPTVPTPTPTVPTPTPTVPTPVGPPTPTTPTPTAPVYSSWIAEREDGLAYADVAIMSGFATNDIVLLDDPTSQCWVLGSKTTATPRYNITGACAPPPTPAPTPTPTPTTPPPLTPSPTAPTPTPSAAAPGKIYGTNTAGRYIVLPAGLKIVWNGTGVQEQFNAQSLMQILTGNPGVNADTYYPLNGVTTEFNVLEPDFPYNLRGTVAKGGSTQAKYFVDGFQTVIQIDEIAFISGDIYNGYIPYNTYRYEIS